jgi:hypothetical protein
MVVPKGKKVLFLRDGKEELLPNINLYLEEDVVLNLNSSFSSFVDVEANKLINIISAYTEEFIGSFSNYFKEFSYQTWTKTDPIGFSFTVGLYMRTSGLIDVMHPAVELMKLPLPTETSKGDTGTKGYGLRPPEPNLKQLIDNNGILSLQVGRILLDKVIIKKVEPTFSQELDEADYPIWAILRIDAETAYSATKQQIDRFLK